MDEMKKPRICGIINNVKWLIWIATAIYSVLYQAKHSIIQLQWLFLISSGVNFGPQFAETVRTN